jgi:thymidine phosphorylase
MGRVHAARMGDAEAAVRSVQAAIQVGEVMPDVPPLIREGIG